MSAPLPPSAPSWRKPAGMFLLLALIAAWSVVVVSLSGPVGRWPGAAQALFYLAAGTVWIWLFPFRRLFAWMETGRWG